MDEGNEVGSCNGVTDLDSNLDDLASDWRTYHHFHLHRAQHRNWVPRFHLLAVLAAKLDDKTRHGGTNRTSIRGVGLLSGDGLASSRLVRYQDAACPAIHLKEHLALTGLVEESDGVELEVEGHTALHLEAQILPDSHWADEVSGWEPGDVAKLLAEGGVLVEHLGVHGRAAHIHLAQLRPVLLLERLFEAVEVKRRHGCAGTAVDGVLALEHVGAERLREAAGGLAEEALEVLDDGGGEGEGGGLVEQGVLLQLILHHELREVPNHL
mmetsp:Transcript_6552/g.11307  ORF Transcript_6552/g.11307 Transcript_6552/m.11307 type:complete len:268 (+) Transcript_6552:470-1273(+)